MMDLLQQEVGVNGDGARRYRFSFIPNGTAAPTYPVAPTNAQYNAGLAASVPGKYVQSVAYNGATGSFIVAFVATYSAILKFSAGVREKAGGPLATCRVLQDPSTTTLTSTTPATSGSIVGLQLVNSTTGAAANYTSTTTGAQIDVEIIFASDPSNMT
jgi:hypothetical protein